VPEGLHKGSLILRTHKYETPLYKIYSHQGYLEPEVCAVCVILHVPADIMQT